MQILLVAVIFFFLGFQLYKSWEALPSYNWNISIPSLLVSLFFMLLFFALAPLPWKFILEYLGHTLSYRKATKIWFKSQIGRYIPGKVWIVFGRVYLCTKEGIPKRNSLLSFFLELAIMTVSAVLVFLASLLFWFEKAPMEYFWYLLVVVVCGLIFLQPSIFGRVLNFGLRVFKKEQVEIKCKYSQLIKLTLVYCMFWIFQGISFYYLANSIYPFDISLLPGFVGVFLLAWTIGFLSFLTPGGLGVREGALAILLSYFVPPPVAVVISIVSRIWFTVLEVLAFSVMVFIL